MKRWLQNFLKWTLGVACTGALSSCASLTSHVMIWSRSEEIDVAQSKSSHVGLRVDTEAYEASLKRWPFISESGLQRRALLYSLLKAQGKGLEPWQQLREAEDLNLELAEISKLRHRSAF